MKKLVTIITSILLIGVFLTPPVAAQTSEALEWNIEVGDLSHFNFRFYLELLSSDTIEDFYFNVSQAPPAIPDPLTDWWSIPSPILESYWANGTDASSDLNLFIPFIFNVAVPIGNWSLLGDLVESVTTWTPVSDTFTIAPNVTLDEWYRWGFSFNYTFGGTDNVYSISYLKSDGSLANVEQIGYAEGTSSLIGIFYMTRDNNTPVVNSPSDINKEASETGYEIVWNGTDMSPAAYKIFKDEVEMSRGFWNSSAEEFTIDVDGLGVGSYKYTIVLYEASGLSSNDTVMVEVVADPTPTPTTTTPPVTTTTTTTTPPGGLMDFLTENILLVGGIAGVGVILIIIVIVRRR
ncbi:MAG: hypothetical protein ACW99G_20690 [Candidatus Thorarchaeota archaeon]